MGAAAMLSTGQRVKWNWGTGEAEGVVDEVFTGKVARATKGKGSRARPRVTIRPVSSGRMMTTGCSCPPAM
jgi:hypothetical protein